MHLEFFIHMHAVYILLSVCVSVYVYTSDLKYLILKLFQNLKYIELFYTLKTCIQMVLDFIYIYIILQLAFTH